MKRIITMAAFAALVAASGATPASAGSITIRTHDRGLHRGFDHSRHRGYHHREISTGSVTKIKKTRTNAFGDRVTTKKVIHND